MNKLTQAREKINEIDKSMAKLFCERMECVKSIAEFKAENHLPILDTSREEQIIEKNSSLIENSKLKAHYINFLKNNIKISHSYQAELYPEISSGILYEKDNIKKIRVVLESDSYDVILGCGVASDAKKYLDLERRVLIITDNGVPCEYSQSVASKCKNATVYTVDAGEKSKSLANFEKILKLMAEHRFTRTDCIVAVGGGVVGDLAGFVASAYMRGIDFYNIPTTLLSQVDSSIGGKVAIDLDGYKNIVGSFYQPKRVLVDPELLLTLDIRQIRSGLAESLKMAATSDAELFEMFESGEYLNDIEAVIERSLLIKRAIVQRDVREGGERRILNFGHTVGHAIESSTSILHGESVALGMLAMCSDEVRGRLLRVMDEMGLPTEIKIVPDDVYKFILRDKKADGDLITVTYVNKIGSAELLKLPIENIKDYIRPEFFGGIQ